MKDIYDRRKFIRTGTIASIGLGLSGILRPFTASAAFQKNLLKVGIIGLDTSHSTAFTKMLNAEPADPLFAGFRVEAAYPKGSEKIEASASRIAGYITEVKKYGVEIVSSVKELLKKVDVVLLESNDGTIRLDQAKQVIRAGKPMFIDKPVAASLRDVIIIYEEAKKYRVPVFSSSSLRYFENINDISSEMIGKVLGADTYSPALLEPSHPDFFWYGIHGVEMLYTVLGRGCRAVSRINTKDTDVVTGVWDDDRIGTFRGTRAGAKGYGGVVFGEKKIVPIISPKNGYKNLLIEIVEFFKTGISPVNEEDTIEIYAFMEAADKSKIQNGAWVSIQDVISKAKKAI
ncbi:Gfo/Idh/MocA family protein [Desertivirga xinjiangensis]|uniref:Gfo/Idh/MocA family protein n=1 Tax=Desertivirga xinjiangensis TaxID=539206 RepID=UPI00210EE3FA|nr:Gfo/Idh/MocA family oxidoreductase [Pedobacter xinjiangensis]